MRRIILKEGPLVFLRNVLVMEIVATIFLYAISFLQNYEMLYRSWSLVKFVRYDIFLIVAFSFFQLFYVSLLFLEWYFTHFEITEKEITKKSGLLFRHRKSVTLSDIISIETYHSPLGRMMNHATIIVYHSADRITKIKNISNADEYVHIIKQMSHNASGQSSAHDVSYLIKEGEGFSTEFKETLRYDRRRKEVNKEIERMVMKTIVAFLNAKGGTLLIGVSDDGEVVGLEDDYKTLSKKNRDGFENHLSMLVKTMIGLPFTKYVGVKFEKIKNIEVCLVSVGESHRPAYLHKGDRKEDFFVRVGNSTQPFSMSETEEYIKTRWK
ncbi:MAG: putative DNA binding domain-containing protein [Patescibacteria group bacterium]|nr:putative DNA binding domain-containing protein [Patescibacteria group bacterium]